MKKFLMCTTVDNIDCLINCNQIELIEIDEAEDEQIAIITTSNKVVKVYDIEGYSVENIGTSFIKKILEKE